MLEFINNNGVLFTCLSSFIVALLSIIVSVVKDNKKSKKETITSLKNELNEYKCKLDKANKELSEIQSLENVEKNIDKTHGAIYIEKFENGKHRQICGYCWEKEHKKIPLSVEKYYDDVSKHEYYDGFCNSCGSHCIDNDDYGEYPDDLSYIDNDELPF